MTLSPDELTRYSRHLLLPEVGPAGQERLRAARVLIVGTGGLGAPAALYLAAGGVGTLGLLDCDRVELSNLQRQVLYDTADVGLAKARRAAARIRALNPAVDAVAHEVTLCAANALGILRGYDVVIDGSDRIATRYLVNDACVLLRKTLVSAAIHRFEGHAMSYVPGRGPCYRCLFPDSPPDLPSCAEAGVLGVLPGVLGVIQATEAIKLITGIGTPLLGRLLTYDALTLRFQEFSCEARPQCAVCGQQPTITQLRDEPAPHGSQVQGVQRLSPAELATLLQERRSPPPLLIDVREAPEFARGHLPGAHNMPLEQLASQLPQLPRDRRLVFVCQRGVRSLQACALAVEAGIDAPAQLEGGLSAWEQWQRRPAGAQSSNGSPT